MLFKRFAEGIRGRISQKTGYFIKLSVTCKPSKRRVHSSSVEILFRAYTVRGSKASCDIFTAISQILT